MTASRSNQRRQRAPSKSPRVTWWSRGKVSDFCAGGPVSFNPWKCNDESFELQSWLKAHNIDFNEICKHNKDSGKFQRMVSVVHTNETENVLDKEITRESLRLADSPVEAMVAYLDDVRKLPSSEQMPPTTVAPECVRLSIQIPGIQSPGDKARIPSRTCRTVRHPSGASGDTLPPTFQDLLSPVLSSNSNPTNDFDVDAMMRKLMLHYFPLDI
uniref:Uncharacterized protein n=1 Tax=Timema tahoe TaxID=61484 RepID=A0A7R9IJP2_9NEOP|nr:unnamed protein product [Timema tahoe]